MEDSVCFLYIRHSTQRNLLQVMQNGNCTTDCNKNKTFSNIPIQLPVLQRSLPLIWNAKGKVLSLNKADLVSRQNAIGANTDSPIWQYLTYSCIGRYFERSYSFSGITHLSQSAVHMTHACDIGNFLCTVHFIFYETCHSQSKKGSPRPISWNKKRFPVMR